MYNIFDLGGFYTADITKSRIKQLGSVRLRVQVGEFERVCRFYVVPNYVRPIFGLPDLTRMQLVRFSMPIVSQWTEGENIN